MYPRFSLVPCKLLQPVLKMEGGNNKTISTQTDFDEPSLTNTSPSNLNSIQPYVVAKDTHFVIKGYYRRFGFQEIKTDEELLKEKSEYKEVIDELLKIADQFDHDKKLMKILGKLDIKTLNKSFFHDIADQIFERGKSWGKIVVLLLLGAKVALMADSDASVAGEMIIHIVEWVTSYILEKLLSWITESGGWISVKEFFEEITDPSRNTAFLFGGLALTVVVVAVGSYYFKND